MAIEVSMADRAPRMGDLGDDQREYEFEPMTAPSVPEPVEAPVTTPEPVAVPA